MPAYVSYRWPKVDFSELEKLLSSNKIYINMIYCMPIIAKTKTNHRLNFSVCPLYSTIFIFTKHTLCFHLKIYYEHFPLAIQILLAYFMIIYVLYYFISKCAVIFLANFLLLVFSVILFSFIFFKKNKFCYQNLYVV